MAVPRSKPPGPRLYGVSVPARAPGYLASMAVDPESASAAGEREFRPRSTGKMFPWVKWASLAELAVFTALVVVWLAPGLEGPTSVLGLAHGLGFVALCILIWIAVLRREVPFWLLASALTPVGPVGSSIGVSYIEHKERRGSEGSEPSVVTPDGPGSAPLRRTEAPADAKSNV